MTESQHSDIVIGNGNVSFVIHTKKQKKSDRLCLMTLASNITSSDEFDIFYEQAEKRFGESFGKDFVIVDPFQFQGQVWIVACQM